MPSSPSTAKPARRSRFARPRRTLLPLLLAALNACGPVSYPADRLPEAVRDLCWKEQKVAVDVRWVGKTLYLACDLEGLVSADFGFETEALETLEGLMLSGTRASLSTDAAVDFLVVRVTDPALGSTFTLLRYIPDVKGLLYFRYSRADFQDRLVIETEGEDPSAQTAAAHDVTLPEFMARLAASRLQRQLTGNPLVSVLLQIQAVRGRVEDGVLALRLQHAGQASPETLRGALIQSAVAEAVGDICDKYDPVGVLVLDVRLEDQDGSEVWTQPIDHLRRLRREKEK